MGSSSIADRERDFREDILSCAQLIETLQKVAAVWEGVIPQNHDYANQLGAMELTRINAAKMLALKCEAYNSLVARVLAPVQPASMKLRPQL